MNFEETKKQKIDLSPIGGQLVSIGDMIEEIREHRRNDFLRHLFSLNEGDKSGSKTFDSIGFLAAIENFEHYFDTEGVNYDGTIIYDVIAGNDWVWHCKTTITWKDAYPMVYGVIEYVTTVVENEKVIPDYINTMSGTLLEINVIQKNLKVITPPDAIERTRRNNCK